MIAVIDYSTGNLRSVENALRRLGADFELTADPKTILSASHVLLPGVGEASAAMAALRDSGLADLLPTIRVPLLGICIGMQLLCRHSQEGDTPCLGLFDTVVAKLTGSDGVKIPHMGWNTVERLRSPLFGDIPQGRHFYYVHSYAPRLCAHTIAETTHGTRFSAALQRDNFFGTQFHPEKSGEGGELILRNFLEL